MKAKHFKDVKTKKQAQERYRELAKELHPDAGGDPEAFKAMNEEYKAACIALDFFPELKRPRKKPVISKKYADEIRDSAGDLAAGGAKAFIDAVLENYFRLKD